MYINIILVYKTGDDGIKDLSDNLGYITKLTDLNINRNNIGNNGMIALSNNLRYITDLKSLNIDNNNIGDDGINVFSDNLSYITKLTELSFYSIILFIKIIILEMMELNIYVTIFNILKI